MNVLARTLIWLAAVVILETGCQNETDSIPAAESSTVIYRGNGREPGSLDPALAEDIHAFNILTDIYEGLVAASATGEIVAAAAESWTVSDDSLTYTFTLREDSRWSNGDPLTSHDFVRAFRRVADPATASGYGVLLQPILHFSEVRSGELSPDQLAVTAINDRVLRIRLTAPTPQILSLLAMPVALPTHVSASRKGAFSDADAFVGNGAYSLVSRSIGGPTRLRRSLTYWDAESVAVEEIVYLPIVDSRTEFNMYRAGELDITHSVPLETVRSLRENMPEQLQIAPSLALYYLAFDTTEPPLDKRVLRQALSMAIDRERLVSLIGRGEQAAFGIVPPGVSGHVAAEVDWRVFSADERIRQAQALYREAGYSNASPLAITYTYDTGDIHEKIALAVTSMWRDVLGVDVRLQKMEWQYFLDTRKQRSEWQIMRFAWFGDYNHASTFTDVFRSGDPQNLPAYTNPDYDRLLADASMEPDLSDSDALIREAEAILLADQPIAPLYFFVSKHLVSPGVGGFEPNVLDRHPSKYLFLEQKPEK